MADYGAFNPPSGPFTEGELTNPIDEALVADTGVLAAGLYEILVTIGATAAAQMRLEKRNATDAAASGNTVVLYIVAGQSGQYRFRYVVAASERFKIFMDDALTGITHGSIIVERLA